MECSMVNVTIFVTFLISLYFLFSKKRPKNYPPGPRGLPIFGNIFQLGKEGYKVSLEMSKKYGDVLGLRFGTRWVVVLNNVDDAREAFSKHEFTERNLYNNLTGETCDDNTGGVIMSQGKIWQEQRRFCLRTLRDFGFGRKSMETIIMEETNDLIEEFKKHQGQPISTHHAFNASVFNVIWSIVAAERYPHDDPQLGELIKLLLELFASSNEGINPFYFLFPSLVTFRDKFPFLFPDSKKFSKKAFEFFRKTIRHHRSTMEEGNPRDLIDTYLEEMNKTTDPESSFYSKNSDDANLIMVLLDLFIAGAETTSTTLIWSFYLFALHKNVQDKFFKEIQTVVGNRQVSLSDKPSLPYIEATMMEILRLSTLAPFSIPHAAAQDMTIKGYFIPKGTNVLGSVYAAHYNPSVWGDPEKFRPERFLSADEKTVLKNNKNLIPFGTGKRVCLGESLARDEFFLFLANLVQTFHIAMPADEPEHTLKLCPTGLSNPEPHKVVLKERNA